MSGLDDFDAVVPRADQLWYVGHPVHPTDEDVAAFRASWDARGRFLADVTLRVEVIKDNIANAKAWLAWLSHRYPSITFIAPWIASLDGGGGNDLDPRQRMLGLRDCCRTIRVCSGLVYTGGRVSSGMLEETKAARRVIDLTGLGRTPPAYDTKVIP